MVPAARQLGARLFPKGLLDVVRQLLLFAGAYYLYRLVRGAVDGKAATSFENARHLISLERSLHVFVEPSVQTWASGKSAIIDFASWMYLNSHFVVTVATLIWLYRFRNGAFYFVRNMFLVAMGLALVGYVVYPTAPPRFFPEWGFTDSVANFTGIDPDSGLASALVNPFAAVPSMHVAWRLYPLLVTFVVVATGNHFLMDAVLGALTAAVSAYVAQFLLARARPNAWAFRHAEAGAPA